MGGRGAAAELARWGRLALPVIALLVVTGLLVWKELRSPDRRCAAMIEEAAALEERGERDAAIARYEQAIEEFAGSADDTVLAPASLGLARLYPQPRPDPVTPRDAARAAEIAGRFLALPASLRTSEASALLGGELLLWADRAVGEEPQQVRARLRLLDAAHSVSDLATQRTIKPRERAVVLAYARQHQADWPIVSLDLLVAAGGDDTIEQCRDLVGRLADQPALLRAAAPRIEGWLEAAAGIESLAGERERLSAALAAARAAAEAEDRRAALEGGEAAALDAALARAPADQEVAVELARLHRAEGDAARALAMLESLGSPGWTTPEAQRLRADLLAELDRLDEADELLTGAVELALPGIDRARRAYLRAFGRADDRLWERAGRGDLPPEVEERLTGRSDAEKQQIVQEWVNRAIDEDPEVTRRWDEYQLHAHVVPAATALGALRMQRAWGAGEPQRTELLAAAERALLLVQEDAQGSTGYHLGLGQVLYRLGRAEEGEAELAGLLELDDPEITYQVAYAYRELGIESRAAELLESVVASGVQPIASEAAQERSVLAVDVDEKEMWLRKADQESPYVQVSLIEVTARRHHRDGELAASDRLWAQAVAHHQRAASSSSAAANNAAVASSWRYSCTGDIGHLQRARDFYEQALRLTPGNVPVIENAAEQYDELAKAELLARHLDLVLLRPRATELDGLVGSLLEGPRGEAMRRELRASRTVRRAIDLSRQAMILSPRSVEPVKRLAGIHERLGSARDLRALRQELEGRGVAMDSGAASSPAVETEDGAASPAAADRPANPRIVELRRIRDTARTRGDRPTEAAALLLESRLVGLDAELDGSLPDALEAARLTRSALERWPAIANAHELGYDLLRIALLRAATDATELAPLVEELRSRQLGILLADAARSPRWRQIAASIAEAPELAEAVRLLESARPALPKLSIWVIGKLGGSAALEGRAADYFNDPVRREAAAINCLVWPQIRDVKVICELMAEQTAARPRAVSAPAR